MSKKVFVYGGNLGKPQGIDFLIECLKSQKENRKVFFLIVGDGTEYKKLNKNKLNKIYFFNYGEYVKNVLKCENYPLTHFPKYILRHLNDFQ